jgi:transketolase
MGEIIDVTKVKKCADYLRYLALESIERAKSGHPGIVLGCAELGILLYRHILNFDPQDPGWLNRDRFILSAGHGSMLLYSLLYLAGYDISLQDLGNFRQLESKTPGHPEYEIAHGIETTTGPLGQGFANAVGCALEGKVLAQRFNEEDFKLFDYTVYTLMGDGCNMEGISYEAGSIAGHLGLDNLLAIYDSNDISIDGHMDLTFSDDIACRYKGLGWHVESATSKDSEDLLAKLEKLKRVKGKPRLLVLKTIIGEGLNKKKNSPAIHGSPAGIDEIVYFIQNSWSKEIFGKKYGNDAVADSQKLTEIMSQRLKNRDPLLDSPECLEFMREELGKNEQLHRDWLVTLENYKKKYPQKYQALSTYTDFKLADSLQQDLLNYSLFKNNSEIKPTAVRAISGKVLNRCAETFPQLMGGSADLTDSTKAKVEGTDRINRENFSGRKIHYGAREHAMGAIGNGLALGKLTIPFSGTFFTFFDYMKPAVRMAALMKLNHIFIFSHDSIYVGEDGPTHQPIEHLNTLRLIPGIHTFRPANDIETAFAYLYFFQQMNGPVAIVTTRQSIPAELFQVSMQRGSDRKILYENFKNGAYIFYESEGSETPGIIFAASGSELALALQTAKLVEERDEMRVRVISLSCLELLAEAPISYREQLFLRAPIPLVLIEAASHRGVSLFYDSRTLLVDIESFGRSAPDKKVGEYFGFTPEAIYQRIKKEVSKR